MRAQTNVLYKYSKDNNVPLLGSNSFDFWAPYLAAYNVYDRYFRDTFKSWYYYPSFEDSTSAADMYDDFADAVQAYIYINQKRYSELFRVQVLAADAYDIVNNYDLTETHSTTRSGSGSNVYGSREDTQSGSNTDGAREDTQSGSATDGTREDTASTTAGAQNTTSEKGIAGFNSSDYSDSEKTETIAAEHIDSSIVNKGAQTNTTDSTFNKGAQTNTTDSTFNKGAQTDTRTESGTESSNIRRYGNIGIQTAADIIGGHIKLWESFNFYKMIFDEVAKAYLLLDYDYDYTSTTSSTEDMDVDEILNAISNLSNQVAAGFTAGAKASQITPVAKSSELADLAKTTDLEDLAKSSELTDLAKSSELTNLADSADVANIRGDIASAESNITESIEGVSTNEY